MKKTVVLISKNNGYLNSIKYSFKNVIELDETLTIEQRDDLVNKVKKYERIIFVDYLFVFRYLMQNLKKEYKWIVTYDISSLSLLDEKLAFKALMEYYDIKLINEIACLDDDFYEVLKKAKYSVRKIKLDVNIRFKVKKGNKIGIVGIDYNPLDNYYNELTALKLTDYDLVNLSGRTDATKNFVNFFDMKYEFKDNDLEVIKSSNYILACSFAKLNLEKILIALDNGVLPIVGNTSVFNNYKYLKKYLVLESDDNVNEISSKLKSLKEHKDEILEEYKKFRKDYRTECFKTIDELLK